MSRMLSRNAKPISYDNPPKLLILEYPTQNLRTSHKLKVSSVDLHLRGIVYLGGFHFTCHLFSENGETWYHDERSTKDICIEDGNLADIQDSDLRECKTRSLVLAIYAQPN